MALCVYVLLAPPYSAVGQSHHESFEASGTLISGERLRFEFTIRVSGAKWVITSSMDSGAERRCGSDGSNFYSLNGEKGRGHSPGWMRKTWRTAQEVLLKKRRRFTELVHTAEVRSGSLPEFDWYQMHLVWLALGSGDIFHGKDEVYLPGSIFLSSEQSKDLVRIRHDEADSRLVTSFEVVDPAFTELARHDAKFSDLATKLKYRVTSTTVLGGLRIPQEFEFVAFGQRTIGKVAVVKPLEGEENGIPKFSEILEVTDHRVNPPIRYKTSRGWLQPSDERFKNLVLGKGGFEEGRSPLRHFIACVGLALGILLSLRRFSRMFRRRSGGSSKH